MNNKNEFAMVALDELIMEMRQTRHVKFADKLETIRAALTAQQPDVNQELLEALNSLANIYVMDLGDRVIESEGSEGDFQEWVQQNYKTLIKFRAEQKEGV